MIVVYRRNDRPKLIVHILKFAPKALHSFKRKYITGHYFQYSFLAEFHNLFSFIGLATYIWQNHADALWIKWMKKAPLLPDIKFQYCFSVYRCRGRAVFGRLILHLLCHVYFQTITSSLSPPSPPPPIPQSQFGLDFTIYLNRQSHSKGVYSGNSFGVTLCKGWATPQITLCVTLTSTHVRITPVESLYSMLEVLFSYSTFPS